MERRVDLPGAAHLVVSSSVAFLDPAPSVFTAMLDGWAVQQASRFLAVATVRSRVWAVRRFAEFSGEYPWQWQPAELEAFTASLRSGPRPVTQSTVRNYQNAVRLFCDYVTDARYGWASQCVERFGAAPAQICHEWNTLAHTVDYEGRPTRRALTFDEVQALFAAAEGRVEQIRTRGRKGAASAGRDAAMLKTVYAYGLRRREAVMLDLADLRRNPNAPGFRGFGAVHVRWGKASNGGPPRRRVVLTVPEMDWVVDVFTDWVQAERPRFDPGGLSAVWVTERRSRVSLRRLDEVFAETRAHAGLPAELDLHCLRHSYVTHLVEFGYPPLFVQQQVGHSVASTTAIYTSVSDEFRNRLLERAVTRQQELWRR